MRIAFLLYDRPGYRAGPIVNARRLLPGLRRRGHEVIALVFVARGYAPNARALVRDGVRVLMHRKPRYTEEGVEWILSVLKQVEPDVFVPNSFVPGWFAARWVREAGIPTICAFRSDEDFYWGMAEEFVGGLASWRMSGVVCVSEYLSERLRDKYQLTEDMVEVIPSGVPIPRAFARQRRGQFLKIVYVGRFVQAQKRIRETVDALIDVLKCLPDTIVTLIGQGYDDEERRIREKITVNGMSDRMFNKGSVDPDLIHEELTQHHIIVLLSDYEGTPGAIMDGMACGLVPVCMDIPGGLRELVVHEETGLLVNNRMNEFIDAITRLHDDTSLRMKLSQNARSRIHKNYSIDRAAEKWETFAKRLALTGTKPVPITIPSPIELPPVEPRLMSRDLRMPKRCKLIPLMFRKAFTQAVTIGLSCYYKVSIIVSRHVRTH